jgi:hypothetical protein
MTAGADARADAAAALEEELELEAIAPKRVDRCSMAILGRATAGQDTVRDPC